MKNMQLVSGFPQRQPGFDPRSGHVGFVVDKVVLGHVFSEYFCFPCKFSFHHLHHTHHLSSKAGTRSQIMANIPNDLGLEVRVEWFEVFDTFPCCEVVTNRAMQLGWVQMCMKK
jgi:hypothetical protein